MGMLSATPIMSAAENMAIEPLPLVLDTDIGDNVDDALALALACRSPELKLVGVTTVYRDPMRRAGIVRQVLRVFGREDVPVAAGVGKPLVGAWDRRPPLLCDLSFAPDVLKLDERSAVRFLIETVLGAPAGGPPLTICAIGPLTNLALALALEPTLAGRIRVVLMGGMIGEPRCETNIAADPEAAQIVFASGADITMVGLDVTLLCTLTQAQVDRIRADQQPPSRLLAAMIDRWSASSGRLPTLHDPLAVATCFDSALCQSEPMDVSVKTCGERRGVTVGCASSGSRTKVCTAVDHERFVGLFLDRLLK